MQSLHWTWRNVRNVRNRITVCMITGCGLPSAATLNWNVASLHWCRTNPPSTECSILLSTDQDSTSLPRCWLPTASSDLLIAIRHVATWLNQGWSSKCWTFMIVVKEAQDTSRFWQWGRVMCCEAKVHKGRHIVVSLVTSPCAPLGEKRSGERSRISWAYYSKAVRTNEIARSVIIT